MQGTVKGGRRQGSTEEEVGRQLQGMDRTGVRQVPEGSGEQGKMEKTGFKIICGAPTTLLVKGLMMLMMMMMDDSKYVGNRPEVNKSSKSINIHVCILHLKMLLH